MNKAIGDIKNGDYYPQTADGEYMITVGNAGNKIIFTDGKYNYYSISKVIEMITSDEYRLDDIRRTIYEREGNGILTENTHLLKIYAGIDYAFSDFRKKFDIFREIVLSSKTEEEAVARMKAELVEE